MIFFLKHNCIVGTIWDILILTKKFVVYLKFKFNLASYFLFAKTGDFNPREHERGYRDLKNVREAFLFCWLNHERTLVWFPQYVLLV